MITYYTIKVDRNSPYIFEDDQIGFYNTSRKYKEFTEKYGVLIKRRRKTSISNNVDCFNLFMSAQLLCKVRVITKYKKDKLSLFLLNYGHLIHGTYEQ